MQTLVVILVLILVASELHLALNWPTRKHLRPQRLPMPSIERVEVPSPED